MIIEVINRMEALRGGECERVVRAVNLQLRDHFTPQWNMGATLRLAEGAADARIGTLRTPTIILSDADPEGVDVAGYHDLTDRGVPFGVVYGRVAQESGEPWSVTLSHEALELVADPQASLLVHGPHPEDRRRRVFHWFELCDAVQGHTYLIDGVEVSNFVLPAYFTRSDEPGQPTHHLAAAGRNLDLGSFSTLPGGYIGFYDPLVGRHRTYNQPGDRRAESRQRARSHAGESRRAWRRMAALRADPSFSARHPPADQYDEFDAAVAEAAPWMGVAIGEVGVTERPGRDADNPRIQDYLKGVGLPSEHDETPWCSAFTHWVLAQSGIAGTGKANARSWLNWGSALNEPRVGAITVFWRESRDSWRGHVGFYVGRRGDKIQVLGGNQMNRVKIQEYPAEQLLGYRWPHHPG